MTPTKNDKSLEERQIIKNYIISGIENNREWCIPDKEKLYSLSGNIAERPVRFDNVKYIDSKRVLVTTDEGKRGVFQIAEPQADYLSFQEAKNGGIPIIQKWNIQGNRRVGYYILGFVGSRPIKKRVIRQVGNNLLLEDEVMYYVLWRDYSSEFSIKMFETAIAAEDIQHPREFEWYGDCKCKPIIIT